MSLRLNAGVLALVGCAAWAQNAATPPPAAATAPQAGAAQANTPPAGGAQAGPGRAADPQTAPSSEALIYRGRPLKVSLTCRAEGFETAGAVCSEEEPCRIFLELNAVAVIGPKIFLVGDLHTPSATVYSLALASDDAGATWKEPLARIPAAGFEAMQFLNDQQGWISVQPQEQFPVDPYLLATTDGGAHWDKFPIWDEQGRGGMLQQFYFDSKDHGSVLIDRSQTGSDTDRYELYETMTGGSSWMLRETSSQPIKPKWSPRPPGEWRIQENAKAKSLDLERRVGNLWTRMADFQMEVGVCKALEASQKIPETRPEAPVSAPGETQPPTAPPSGPAGVLPSAATDATPENPPKSKPAAPPTLKRPSELPPTPTPNL